MTHPLILKKINERSIPFTESLVEGWHLKDSKGVINHLDMCYRSMFKILEEKGVYYDGIERVCPLEFYKQITRSSGSGTKEFEIAKNSFFGVKLNFHYIDPVSKIREELKSPHIFLYYTNKHGDIYVRNSIWSLQFVLAERGPSVDGVHHKTIFIRVLGYRFKVGAELHNFIKINNYGSSITRTTLNVKLPANRFYNSKNDRKIKTKATPIPILSWYVFGCYGFKRAMTEYAECEYVINDEETLLRECKPKDGWEIYANTGKLQYKTLSKLSHSLYEPAIAIRGKNKEPVSPLGFQYVGALLYMFGVMNDCLDLNSLNDPNYWRLIIGKCSIRLPGEPSTDVYLRQMAEHFVSIDTLADGLTLDRYNKINIKVKNTYEFFNYLTINFSNIIKTYSPSDLLHKELASMEFLVENLIHSANEFKFKIRNKSNITPKIINREIDAHFKLFGIDKSVRENNTILEQTGTDNPFIDYGLGLILQTKSNVSRGQGRKKEEFDPNHPSSLIDPSQPFVVSYQAASSPSPNACGQLQPRVYLVDDKYTAVRPEDKELYEKTAAKLKGTYIKNED